MQHYIVVVANASICRFYTFILTKSEKVKFLKAVTHPDSRKHNLDIATDKPGRAKKDYRVQKIAFSSASEPKEIEKNKFIKQIEKELNEFINNDLNINFIFIAEPTFMGKLNISLNTKITSRVKHKINRNLSLTKELELSEILKNNLKPTLKA